MIRLLIYPILFLALGSSCQSSKFTPEDYPDSMIQFGSGGGIANLVTEYTLFENGQFFKKMSSDTAYTILPKIKSNELAQIFENISVLNLGEVNFTQPGNMTTFIKIKTEDVNNEIAWGNPMAKTPKNVELFYALLMNQVNSRK